jgi:hypothetical protein
MNPKTDTNLSAQPKLVPSLANGFNSVSSHIWLIALPVVVDLFLWLGPHFKVKSLVQPYIEELIQMPGATTGELSEIVMMTQSIWTTFIDRVNLAAAIRTLPLGVPSLMSGMLPNQTPFGAVVIYEIQSAFEVVSLWMVFVLIGLMLGSLYFNGIARVINGDQRPKELRMFGWTMMQVFLMTLILLVIGALLCIPGLVIFPLLLMISPGASQFSLIIGIMILIWLMLPLVFTPHSIFSLRQSAWIAMITSARLVRRTSYSTGFFFLLAIMISEGMDILWGLPPQSSWMSIIGILGHAFITTSLVAASFVYYRDALRWSQSLSQTPVRI